MKALRGFTLIELLVTLAVVVITVTVGIPSFAHINNSSRLTVATNTLISSLHLARSETLKRNVRVSICKSSNGRQCQTNQSWSDGWIVFVDCNDNHRVDQAPVTCLNGDVLVDNQGKPVAESVISVVSQPPKGVTISGSHATANYVTYYPPGYAHAYGDLTLCPLSGEEFRKIIISSSGKVKSISPESETTTLILNPCG